MILVKRLFRQEGVSRKRFRKVGGFEGVEDKEPKPSKPTAVLPNPADKSLVLCQK